jgi:UDP-2,4-diacetamido-2,4,6-trideoxy-beta-L-altropyranose hydrolase
MTKPLYKPKISTVNKQHFVFFANASSSIGAGHVMRLFALAQACCRKDIKVSFASYECPEYLLAMLSQEGFGIITLPANFTLNNLEAFNANVIVVDDYHLSDEQWQYFKNTKALLVNIDDEINNKALISDIIINPAATAKQITYNKRAPQARLCLGPEYTLLRHEFVEQHFIDIEQRKRILITLGGADVKNMSLALAQGLIQKPLDKAEIFVLLGGLHSQALAPLQTLASQHNNLFIIENSQQVAELMMQSGLAITAAGGTLGELACVGTPSIALVSVDNQKAALSSTHSTPWFIAHDVRSFIAEELSPSDVAHNAQIIDEITAQAHELWRDLCKRKHMSTQARQLIDGRGCDRIVEQILLSL